MWLCGGCFLIRNSLREDQGTQWSHLSYNHDNQPRLSTWCKCNFNLFQEGNLNLSVWNFLMGLNVVICHMGPLHPPKGTETICFIRHPTSSCLIHELFKRANEIFKMYSTNFYFLTEFTQHCLPTSISVSPFLFQSLENSKTLLFCYVF